MDKGGTQTNRPKNKKKKKPKTKQKQKTKKTEGTQKMTQTNYTSHEMKEEEDSPDLKIAWMHQ